MSEQPDAQAPVGARGPKTEGGEDRPAPPHAHEVVRTPGEITVDDQIGQTQDPG